MFAVYCGRIAKRLCGILFIVTSLCACTVVGHVKTEDWPALRVTENKVGFGTMLEHCSKYVHPLMWPPLACAEVNLTAGACTIWYVWDTHLEHERLHCQGYDHVGGDTFAQLVAQHRAATANRALALSPTGDSVTAPTTPAGQDGLAWAGVGASSEYGRGDTPGWETSTH